MDSPFQVSDCRTSSAADRDLLASPSPIFYRCSASFTPAAASLPPWSPFSSPFQVSLASISPIVRSQQRPLSPSTSSTPFVQRLLSARLPPPSSPLSLSSGPPTNFDSPLSSPSPSEHLTHQEHRSSPESVLNNVKPSPGTPSTPLPRSAAPDRAVKRKARSINESTHHPRKFARPNPQESSSESLQDQLQDLIVYKPSVYPVKTHPFRTFPPEMPLHTAFPLFYRRFPVSSHRSSVSAKISGATFNAPRNYFDLYTPRFVKGTGREKLGLCPVCIESTDRGGHAKKVFLSTKFSAFKCYHMQYSHGISVVSAAPFSPPIAFRVKSRSNVAKHERDQITEGKCHKCKKWVALETVKDTEVKVKEIFWWKHAAACHQGSTVAGECDIYLDDSVYESLVDSKEQE